MSKRPSAISQRELTGYAKAMTEAGVPNWSVAVEKPDGTKILITAGEVQASTSTDLDKALGIR